MMFKKSQITVIEISLLIMLFSFGIVYIFDDEETIGQDYDFQIQTVLDVLYYNDTFREILISENLSNSSLTENWTNIEIYLNKSFQDYELEISNGIESQLIYSCVSNYYKQYGERIISINSNNYEFRTVKLGVCY